MKIKSLMLMACLPMTAVAGAPALAAAHHRTSQTPQSVADELLAADRAFSLASSQVDTVTGLSAMFADDILVPLPNATFARGKAAAIEALHRDPFNTHSRTEWAPVRVGVSADGQQGFSFGYMTSRGEDGSTRIGKYLIYWIRTPEGWRAEALRRGRRPEGPVSTAMMPPSLPGRIVPATTDQALLARDAQSLRDAEQAFSDEAQRVGNGAAFQQFGSEDAMNMGRDASFAIGALAIGAAIGPLPPGQQNPVNWHSDDVLVASSGDLGISWGVVRPNRTPAAGEPAGGSFFTVWHRSGRIGRWLYIAE